MSTEAMRQAQAAIKSALDFYSAMFGIPVDSMLVTHHSEAKALFEKCMAAMESLSQALAKQPLTNGEIDSIIAADPWTCDVEGEEWNAAFIRISRAIEAAHGITKGGA